MDFLAFIEAMNFLSGQSGHKSDWLSLFTHLEHEDIYQRRFAKMKSVKTSAESINVDSLANYFWISSQSTIKKPLKDD